MSSIYFERLDDASKEKYLCKLSYNGIVLPDPLDIELRLRLFKSRYLKISPTVTFGDIYMFLVEFEQVYTREDFKNYKTLDPYKMVVNNKVKEILAYKCSSTNMCVLTCDVQDLGTEGKLYRPWTVISSDGVIQSGHCTCMDGIGSICLHISALLLSLEMAVKKDIAINTEDSCFGEQPSNKSKSGPMEYFSQLKKPYSPRWSNTSKSLPSKAITKKRLRAIKKIVPNAAIFTVLSDSDLSSMDEDKASESQTALQISSDSSQSNSK